MTIYIISLFAAIALYALWRPALRFVARADRIKVLAWAAGLRAVAWALGPGRREKFLAELARQVEAEPDPARRHFQRQVMTELLHE